MKIPVLKTRDEKGNLIPINAIRGDKGKSAYEQAQEGGYKGTEEEFIALLNGLTSSEAGEHYADFNNPHKVTKEQIGLSNVNNVEQASKEEFDMLLDAFGNVSLDFLNHKGTQNPHKVTAEMTEAVPEAYYLSPDLNNEIQRGGGKTIISCYNNETLNTPYSDGLTAYAHGMVITNACSNQYGTQLCMPSGSDILYSRAFNGQGVTSWKQIANEDGLSNKASIATGIYKGTGTYGDKKPNTLTFDFVPKYVFVCCVDDMNVTNGKAFIWVNPASTINFNNNGSNYWCRASLNGTTLSWYSTESSTYQLNYGGDNYSYIAWG